MGQLFCVAPLGLLTRCTIGSLPFINEFYPGQAAGDSLGGRGKKWLCMIVGGGQVVSEVTRPVSGSVWPPSSNCHRKWSLLPPAPPGALSSSSRHPPSCASGDPKPVESYDTEGLTEINSFHYSLRLYLWLFLSDR